MVKRHNWYLDSQSVCFEPHQRQEPRNKQVNSAPAHSFVKRKLTEWPPPPQTKPDSEGEMDISAICPSKSKVFLIYNKFYLEGIFDL